MNFLIIILFVGIGWLVKTQGWLSKRVILLINQYVIFVCLPAIALLKIPQLSINFNLAYPILMAWLLIPVVFVLVNWVASKYRWNTETIGCLLMLTCFGNTSFVGFPIIQAFHGEQALAYAVVYDQLGSFLGLAVVGNFFIAKYSTKNGSHESKLPIKSLVKKVISFPPFIALIVAFGFGDFFSGDTLVQVFSLIAKTLVPATMFLVGLHFEFRLSSEHYKPLAWVLVIKMFSLPVIAFVILNTFQQQGLSAQVTLMESAMPPMVTASILAIHANLRPSLAAAAVGYGLLLSVFSMPLVYWFGLLLK